MRPRQSVALHTAGKRQSGDKSPHSKEGGGGLRTRHASRQPTLHRRLYPDAPPRSSVPPSFVRHWNFGADVIKSRFR